MFSNWLLVFIIFLLSPTSTSPHSEPPRSKHFPEEQTSMILSNEHHEWLKKRDWPSVLGAMTHPDRDVDLLRRKYKER